MRILYAAIDQRVPGTLGGSVHVRSVAEGLAARGHEVHVLAAPGAGPFPVGPVRAARVLALARAVRPDVVIERYHNFGGEGIRAAARVGARAVLEVNAPIVDHPGSRKAAMDRALLVRPLARWRAWQCAHTDLFVTPSRAILPPGIGSDRVLEIEWGADTDRFRPEAGGPPPFERPRGVLAVFAGAFRAWHGAIHLVEAIRRLRARGVEDMSAVFIGDGPERRAVIEAARGVRGIVFTGALPHEAMPAALAAADIGVAPFDLARHPPLSLAFYWSPLKVFEYMASGLPVVAPAIPRLATLVEHGREGVLYEGDADGVAGALLDLRDHARRRAMGAASRARAVRDYSWRAHCARLEDALLALGPRLQAP